jgi:hypothetical protein
MSTFGEREGFLVTAGCFPFSKTLPTFAEIINRTLLRVWVVVIHAGSRRRF